MFSPLLFTTIALFAAPAAATFAGSINMATWLADTGSPQVSEAIVILAGDPSRAFEAAALDLAGGRF